MIARAKHKHKTTAQFGVSESAALNITVDFFTIRWYNTSKDEVGFTEARK